MELAKENNIDSALSIQDLAIPTNIDEALQDPTWKKYMDDKYEALIKKKEWDVVVPPPNINIVGSHWTHNCKHNQEGTARAKSQVVAQGFTQTFGVNYNKTYTPVSQLASLQTICAIAAQNDWLIHQMDIYNALSMQI